MDINELKRTVGEHHEHLNAKASGGVVISGPNGPVGMTMIDALVSALEFQDSRIRDLEKAIANLPR